MSDKELPTDEQIRDLRARVAAEPRDFKLRFDFGHALFRRADFRGAIPELQLAQMDPASRRSAMQLLAESFEAIGMVDFGPWPKSSDDVGR